ncbi:MAG: hypothetical protein K5654_10435 [Lachnospiraceae bacterium]|nr:hypothetical protein [Lachnospiraceae bacterium]
MIYKCKACGGALEYSAELNQMVCPFCKNSFDVNDVSTEYEEDIQEELNNSPFYTANQPESRPNSNVQNNAFVNPAGAATQFRIVGGSQFAGGTFNQFASDEVGDYNTVLKRKEEEKKREEARNKGTVEMHIMKCTSCGAELAVNGVESSTFCAYCGQPTVVADRVESYLKPDYIIPFKVNRNDAYNIIKNTFERGFFIPKGIKEFEAEKIRGIYVPFWLFDMYYHDRQWYKYSKKQGKSSVTRYELFEGETNFRRMTLDASKNLNDDSSSRLEPYDMRQLKEFDMAYLSGYYSDRFDMGVEAMTGPAVEKAMELYNEAVVNELHHKTAKLVSSNPDYNVNKTEYALLPAWFITFRYDNQPYTILVNGQTAKMVGAVPYVKKKVYAVFISLALALSFIGVIALMAISRVMFFNVGLDEKITWVFIGLVIMAIAFLWSGAIKNYKSLMKSLSLTTASRINKFAKERQDR